MRKDKVKKIKREKIECQFNKDGICEALCCYDTRDCVAKDKNNQPKYK